MALPLSRVSPLSVGELVADVVRPSVLTPVLVLVPSLLFIVALVLARLTPVEEAPLPLSYLGST